MAQFELQPRSRIFNNLLSSIGRKPAKRNMNWRRPFEAGAAIRNGDHSLANLESIVRWKSERVVHYLIGNSEAKIRRVLAVAAAPETSMRNAMEALTSLRGVDLPIASAILAAIWPERYNVLDFRALEALGHARHNVEFYAEYVNFCRRLAERGIVRRRRSCRGRRRCTRWNGRFGSGRGAMWTRRRWFSVGGPGRNERLAG